MASPQPALVELRNVTLWAQGRLLFRDTSWSICPGEHWAIVGPNGSGKSALARALSGDAALAGGEVSYPAARAGERAGWVAEVDFGDQAALVRRHSTYLQSRYESLEGDHAPTVGELLARRSAAPSLAASSLLDRLGLRPLLDRRVVHLSNGEARKTLIARALLGGPRVLVLDDPLEGLDAPGRRELVRILGEVGASGVSIVVVAARPRDVPPPVDRVVLVRDGKVVGWARRRNLARSLAAPVPAARASGSKLPPPTRRARAVPGRALVELREVTVDYGGVRVLDRVSWTVREGESWALVGPNGSGKTTLLSLILADNPQAYANDVRVFGHQRGDGLSIWEIRELLGHVSPEAQIHADPSATVLEGICAGFADGARLRHVPSPRELRAARAWARALDLGALLNTPLRALSDGERRLALLARALAKGPRLLVLDEPCQGLDEEHSRRVLGAVDELCRRGAFTVIFVTHEPSEIPPCVGNVLRLEQGRVTSTGRLRPRSVGAAVRR
jgi:molybdate transport system ATP-binding protein